MFLLVLLWIPVSLIAALIAGKKGRSRVGFFFLSLLISPIIGLIVACLVSPKHEKIEEKQLASGRFKKCRFCFELIRSEAVICKHCKEPQANQA